MFKLRKYLLSGLAITLPIALTLYLIFILFKIADGFLNSFFKKILGVYIPGLGIIVSLAIILIAGILTTHFFNKRLYQNLERWFLKFPFVKRVYPSLKQFSGIIFSKDNKLLFNKVVLVEYPRLGIWSLGFLTNEAAGEIKQKTNRELVNILIPTTPTPLSGFMIIVPKSDVIFLDMTVEDALKMIVSGGMLLPLGSQGS
jgi:uncharacterized membrane protein